MSSFKVGIVENVKFNFTKNDKGTLIIEPVIGEGEQSEEDFLAELNKASVDGSSEGGAILVYPLQTKGFENKVLVEVRSLKAILDDIKDFKAFLTYLLSQYMPINDINWDIFGDSVVTAENYKEQLVTNEGLLIVYKNLVDQFVAYTQSAEVDLEKLFRVKFVRTSKKDNRPNFPRRYLSNNTFIESMDIPAEQSKVKFTDGEKKAGLDTDAPVADDQATEDKDLSVLGV